MSMLLTACGSKGDLYQVEEPISVNKSPTEGSQPTTQFSAEQMSRENFQESTEAHKKKSY